VVKALPSNILPSIIEKDSHGAGVNLVVRETAGALENLELLKDPNSGVQIGFLTGGLSNSEDAPNLSSMGLISNVPFWIFYPSSESLTGLSQLRGKRIAVGPERSGARYTAERLLGRADINAKTATLLPFSGNAAVEALMNGSADVALIVGGSDAPSVAKLLTNPKLRLMNFSTAEALTRVFPDLVRLVLPKGVIEIDPPNPPEDITLVGTTARVLIRDDLHPAIVQLLAQTMKEEHQGSGLFQRKREFPATEDPEFRVSLRLLRKWTLILGEVSAVLDDRLCAARNRVYRRRRSDRFSRFWVCAEAV
jgi:TRAP-type uncharacterized transport system substrate-binding protein